MPLGSFLPPGLAGYYGTQQLQQEQAGHNLQSVLGVLGAVQRQQQMQQEAQFAPLKLEMLRSQLEEAQRKSAQGKAVDEAIAALPENQRSMARIAPAQFVSGQFKNPLEGAPDIIKLQAYEKTLRDAGKVKEADQVAQVISNREAGGTSTYERAFRTLNQLQDLANSGQQLTPEQTASAQSARAILSQSQMRIDPVTKEPYWAQPITIPQTLTVGGGAPQVQSPGGQARPTNQLPSTSSGRASLDAGSEKELNLIGDARAMASDLKNSFKPQFAGWKSDTVASVAQEIGRRFGNEKMNDASKFWEAYNQWVVDIRHGKFGATLTGNELRAFEQLIARPSQDPKMVQNNLQRQMSLIEQSMGRRMTSLARQGINQSAIEGAVGFGTPRGASLVNTTQPADAGDAKIIDDLLRKYGG